MTAFLAFPWGMTLLEEQGGGMEEGCISPHPSLEKISFLRDPVSQRVELCLVSILSLPLLSAPCPVFLCRVLIFIEG